MAQPQVRYTFLGTRGCPSVMVHGYAAVDAIRRSQRVGFQTQEHAVTDREGKPLTVVSEHGQSGVWCTYEFQGE